MAVAVVETFKQESMYGLSVGIKKNGVYLRWALVEVQFSSFQFIVLS